MKCLECGKKLFIDDGQVSIDGFFIECRECGALLHGTAHNNEISKKHKYRLQLIELSADPCGCQSLCDIFK